MHLKVMRISLCRSFSHWVLSPFYTANTKPDNMESQRGISIALPLESLWSRNWHGDPDLKSNYKWGVRRVVIHILCPSPRGGKRHVGDKAGDILSLIQQQQHVMTKIMWTLCFSGLLHPSNFLYIHSLIFESYLILKFQLKILIYLLKI